MILLPLKDTRGKAMFSGTIVEYRGYRIEWRRERSTYEVQSPGGGHCGFRPTLPDARKLIQELT